MRALAADPLCLGFILLAALAAARLLDWLGRLGDAGAGYKAKVLASAVFVSGREAAAVLAEDVRLDSYWILRLFGARVGRESVSASFLGLRPRTAAYRPGRGVTLGRNLLDRPGPAKARPLRMRRRSSR